MDDSHTVNNSFADGQLRVEASVAATAVSVVAALARRLLFLGIVASIVVSGRVSGLNTNHHHQAGTQALTLTYDEPVQSNSVVASYSRSQATVSRIEGPI